MYIQVTTKCNMRCGHCCYACEPGKGEHMPFEVFAEVLSRWGKKILVDNQWIVIGGGEPTLHPDFWKIISHALSYGPVWVATNGSNTEDALTLCRMAKRGVLRGVLSRDKWHEPIDPVVVETFMAGLVEQEFGYWTNDPKSFDSREIRTVKNPYIGGHAKAGLGGCPCRGVHIKPDGNIYSCGCETAVQIGTVTDGIAVKYQCVSLYDGCYKEWIGN